MTTMAELLRGEGQIETKAGAVKPRTKMSDFLHAQEAPITEFPEEVLTPEEETRFSSITEALRAEAEEDKAAQTIYGGAALTPFGAVFQQQMAELGIRGQAPPPPGGFDELMRPLDRYGKPIESITQGHDIGSFIKAPFEYATMPTEEAQGFVDWGTRVLPTSAAKLLPGIVRFFAYDLPKPFSDAVLGYLKNRWEATSPAEFRRADWDLMTDVGHAIFDVADGLARFSGEQIGVYGLDDFKRRWLTDPAGAVLGIMPFVKGIKGMREPSLAETKLSEIKNEEARLELNRARNQRESDFKAAGDEFGKMVLEDLNAKREKLAIEEDTVGRNLESTFNKLFAEEEIVKAEVPTEYKSKKTDKPFKTKASTGIRKKQLAEEGIETDAVKTEGGWVLRPKEEVKAEAKEKPKEETKPIEQDPADLANKLNIRYDGSSEMGHSWTILDEGQESTFMTRGTEPKEVGKALKKTKEDYRVQQEIDREIARAEELPDAEPTNSPFFENKEVTEIQKKIYQDPERQASIQADPEIFVMKLVNDVNRWFHGENVDIAKVRKGLSDMSVRGEELWQMFSDPKDHRQFVSDAKEAAAWAKQLDRGQKSRTEGVKLYSGLPVDMLLKEFREYAQDILKYIKGKRSSTELGNILEQVTGEIKAVEGLPKNITSIIDDLVTTVRSRYEKTVEKETGLPFEKAQQKLTEDMISGKGAIGEIRGDIVVERGEVPIITPKEKFMSQKLYSGIDPTQAFKQVSEMFDRMEKEKKVPIKKKIKESNRFMKRKFLDPSANAKVDLEKMYGEEGVKVVQEKILSRGANARGARIYKQALKEVYGKLKKADQKLLDRMIFARRVMQIDEIHGEGKKKHPGDLGGSAHAGFLEELKRQDPVKYEDMINRADAYFDVMRDQLLQLKEEGLISEAQYQKLSKFDYSRRQMINLLDPEVGKEFTIGRSGMSVRDSGVQSLRRGEKSDVLETDSQLLMLEVVNRTQGRIMNNRANQALLELARDNPESPLVREKIKGVGIPKGWKTVKMFEEGKTKELVMSPDFAKEWVKTDAEISYNMANLLRVMSGSVILRPMATGINVGFAFANLPRDLAHIWMASNIYQGGKWKSTYSPAMPVALGQMGVDLATVSKDALLRRGRFDQYIEEGGGMEFLVHQGRILQKRLGVETGLDKIQNVLGYVGETSEIISRLALRERAIKKEARARGVSIEEARKNSEITKKASSVARDYMDFGQAGGYSRAMDAAIPYLNASIQGTRGVFRSAIRDPKTFGVKSAQIAAFTTGLYMANKYINEDAYNAVSEEVKTNNFVITTPWKFTDTEGQERYIYFTIPKDPSQKFMARFFEDSTRKILGEDVDAGETVKTLKELMPITEQNLLPPSAQSLIGYTTNTDFWNNEDIWKRGKVDPEEEYIPGQTGTFFVDTGQAVGMSPERLEYSMQRLFTQGNLYSYMVGLGYEKLFSNVPENEREQHIAAVLSKMPISKRFIKVTNPYTEFAEEIDNVETDVNTKRWVNTRNLDMLAEGYLFQDNVKKSEITKLIRDVGKKDGVDEAERLLDRFEFQVKTKDLPERTFWLKMQRMSPEGRARIFVKRWDSADQEEKQRMTRSMSIIGKGVFTDKFFQEAAVARRNQ